MDFAIPGLMDVPPVIVAAFPKCQAIYNPRPVYYGDQWPGIPGLRIRISPGGPPPPTPLLAVEVSFFKRYHEPGNTPATGCILTETHGVTILSAADWTVSVPPQVLPLDVGSWDMRIRTNDAIEGPQTRVIGTIQILA